MRPYSISRHLSICEKREERINGVVGERPSVNGKTGLARWIVEKHLWQHRLCDARRFFGCITANVLHRVREGRNELGVVRRFASNVGITLLNGQSENHEELKRPRSALHLHPPFA